MALPQLSEELRNSLAHVQLPDDWKSVLAEHLLSENMTALRAFLKEEITADKTIYPPSSLMFNAFNSTPLSSVKVVVIGQDPYHGHGQAHGLSFSVPKGIPQPPSLRNILHELSTDMGFTKPQHGELTHWANQGVLLLNSVLTVEAGKAASHQKKGWEVFTDAVIHAINQHTEHTVFILWGSYAQRKGRFIDEDKHLILTAVHPSPLAANRGGFFGTQPFSKANMYLRQYGKEPIDWQLPE